MERSKDAYLTEELETRMQPATPRPARRTDVEAKDIALAIAAAGFDKKALRIEIIDVQGKVDYADYVVIMSGRSDRQVNALAQGIRETMKKDHQQPCYGVEGLPQGSWVLMDFGDVIVHIFHQDTRGYYDLEALWIDAARVDVGFEQDDDLFPR
ncbi:MAG: ribosome silencing factor [Myxococcota bacterium]